MRRWIASALILASTASGATACGGSLLEGQSCGGGKGHWIEDESDSLKGGYTVIVRICVDDGGNVIDLEVD